MAIALDQDIGFAGSSTTSITVSGTFPAGALICVCVGFATANSGQSISQSGNAFTSIATSENSATNNLVYFNGYIQNWAGGALSTTFTLSGTGMDAGARLLSFTGVATSSALDFSHAAGGAPKSTTMDSGAATGTTGATDLLVGFFTWANTNDISGDSPGGTPSSGWTETAHSSGSSGNTPHGHAVFSYQILSSAATNPDASITFTTPSAGVSYSATVADFAAGSGGTVNGAGTGQLTTSGQATAGQSALGALATTGSASAGHAARGQATTTGQGAAGQSAQGQTSSSGQGTSGGVGSGQTTGSGSSVAGSDAVGQLTTSGVGTAMPIAAGAGTGQLTTVGRGTAGAAGTLAGILFGTALAGAAGTGQLTTSGTGTAQAKGGILKTPRGTLAAAKAPAGRLRAGKSPAGTIEEN